MRIYRASSFGGCMKAQIAAHLDYTPIDQEKKMANMSREGALHELAVIDRLTIDVENRQMEVELDMLADAKIVGHVDGTGDGHVIEIKSMSPDEYRKWIVYGWDSPGFVQKYKWQVSIYMLATKMPLMFCVKNRSSGDLDVSYWDEPPYDKEAIFRRLLQMEKWVRKEQLPDVCDVKNFPCPFYYLEQQIALEFENDEELERAAIAYEIARKEVKDKEDSAKEARKELDRVLAGREKVVTEKVKVTYYERAMQKVDIEKMKGDGIDIEKYTRPVVSKQLRVTVREAKDDGSRSSDSSGGNSGSDGDESKDSERETE